jgi:hypothetical protein
MRRTAGLLGVTMLTVGLLALAAPVRAQAVVSKADLDRLELALADARRDLAQLRARDAARAAALEKELEQLADEVTYLKVKTAKEGHVPRSEYTALRDRIDDWRARAGAGAPASRTAGVAVPVGTTLDVRLQTTLSSATSKVEERFEATTVHDVVQAGRVVIPAGSVVRGVVAKVDKATRGDRTGSLTLTFDRISIRGRAYAIKATVTDKVEASTKEEVGKIGGAAAAGAIVGAILGGGKGAAIGAILGGGGLVAATPGTDVELPAGTVLRIRLDTELIVG